MMSFSMFLGQFREFFRLAMINTQTPEYSLLMVMLIRRITRQINESLN